MREMETHIMKRPTGAVAIKLDADILLNRARAAQAARDPQFKPELLDHGPRPQMLIAVDRGVPAVINGEGRGEVEEDEGLVDVWFAHGCLWETVALTLDDLSAAATGETIDLAEGIRSFGDRLDMNHHRWFHRYDRDYRPASI